MGRRQDKARHCRYSSRPPLNQSAAEPQLAASKKQSAFAQLSPGRVAIARLRIAYGVAPFGGRYLAHLGLDRFNLHACQRVNWDPDRVPN